MAKKKNKSNSTTAEESIPTSQSPALQTPRLALLRVATFSSVFTGIASLLFFVIVDNFTNVNPLTPIRNLDLGLLVLSLIFTFWYIKNGRENGRFQFWEGLFVGFVVTLFSAILNGGLVSAYLVWFKPEVLSEYIKWSVDIAEKMHKQTLEHFTEDGYQAQLKSIKAMNAFDIWQDTLIKKLVASIILVPIIATLMRKTILSTHAVQTEVTK